MNKLHWILQSNLIKKETIDQIKYALETDHITYEEVKIIPFSDELPSIEENNYFKVFYGSTSLILNAYKNQKFKEGVFYDHKKFKMSNYLKTWSQDMLNSDSILTSLAEFSKKNHPNDSQWFLRPNEDDKSFSGTVMDFVEIKNLTERLKDSNNPYLSPKTSIQVSSPKLIQKEWRHFIVNKKVISTSRYLVDGILDISGDDVPNDLILFVEKNCGVYTPHDIFVMDTALYNNNYYIRHLAKVENYQ